MVITGTSHVKVDEIFSEYKLLFYKKVFCIVYFM